MDLFALGCKPALSPVDPRQTDAIPKPKHTDNTKSSSLSLQRPYLN